MKSIRFFIHYLYTILVGICIVVRLLVVITEVRPTREPIWKEKRIKIRNDIQAKERNLMKTSNMISIRT